MQLLPPDLPNWRRNDGTTEDAPLRVFAGGQPDRYWSDVASATDGCLRNAGARKGDRFICVPVGIRPAGLEMEAKRAMQLRLRPPQAAR
jgi:hypothetical protein